MKSSDNHQWRPKFSCLTPTDGGAKPSAWIFAPGCILNVRSVGAAIFLLLMLLLLCLVNCTAVTEAGGERLMNRVEATERLLNAAILADYLLLENPSGSVERSFVLALSPFFAGISSKDSSIRYTRASVHECARKIVTLGFYLNRSSIGAPNSLSGTATAFSCKVKLVSNHVDEDLQTLIEIFQGIGWAGR